MAFLSPRGLFVSLMAFLSPHGLFVSLMAFLSPFCLPVAFCLLNGLFVSLPVAFLSP